MVNEPFLGPRGILLGRFFEQGKGRLERRGGKATNKPKKQVARDPSRETAEQGFRWGTRFFSYQCNRRGKPCWRRKEDKGGLLQQGRVFARCGIGKILKRNGCRDGQAEKLLPECPSGGCLMRGGIGSGGG